MLVVLYVSTDKIITKFILFSVEAISTFPTVFLLIYVGTIVIPELSKAFELLLVKSSYIQANIAATQLHA